MHKKLKFRRILSMALAALMLATTLPETGIRVDAAENVTVESMDEVNSTADVSNGDVSTGDVSDGNLLLGEDPADTEEPGVTEEPGDVGSGNICVKTVSDGNEGQELNKSMPEFAEILASGISRGCAWTLDVDGNLVVRDSDGEYGTDEWGWNDYRKEVKTVDMDISYTDSVAYMFYGYIAMESARIKIDECIGSAEYMFGQCEKLTLLELNDFKTNGITKMSGMFSACKSLTALDISSFETRNVTKMDSMFNACESLATLDITGFDTQNVTDMRDMFFECYNLSNLDLSNFVTRNCTRMDDMFGHCVNLKYLDVSKFETSNVTDMSGMFSDCTSLEEINISNFDTRNVTNMYAMFGWCRSLTTLDVSNFNTKNVTNMVWMFLNCNSLSNLDVSCFDTQNVTSMRWMFQGCSGLTTIDVSGFDTQNITDMSDMFIGCTNLKIIKTFPNLQLSVALPVTMYDKGGKSYTEFPKGLPEGIWLAKDVKDIPKEFSFEKANYELREGLTCQLTLINLPSGVQTSQFNFVSSNPEIVTVDETGLVTAISVGTANVTAFHEKYKCTCTITVLEKGFFVEEIEAVTYTGSAVKPKVVVYDSNSILTEGVDYTLAYANNTVAADKDSKRAPKVTVTGKGNYTGKVVATFTILPYNVKEGGVQVSLPQSVLTANGKVQKPAPVVTFNGKKLAANKDYTVSYPQLAEEGAYKNPGTYDVQVTFKNNFTGTKTVKVEIKEGTSISKVKVGAIAKMPYTGEGIIPKPVITMGTKTLVEGTDYKLTYINNILPGKATVKITGMGEYVGERTLTFEITGTSISKAQVTGITDKTYNGKIQLQDLKVSLDNGTTFLTEGVDYKVIYEKNMNVGTAKVKIVGAGGYVGSINKSFRILPYNLTNDVDKAITGVPENLVVSYIKGGCKPELTLMFHEYRMDQKKECTISFTNNTKLGNASDTKAPTITIKGKGNFTGTITIPFTIVANDLSAEDTSVKLTVADVAYVNKAGKYISTPVLLDSNGKKLAAGTDYEKNIVYTMGGKVLDPKKDIVPVGSEVTVTVTGKGFYTGTISATYRITEKTFTSAKITVNKQTYTGKPIQLTAEDIKVVNGKDTLVYGVDFEVVEDSYLNNVAKGTASVTIKGKGKYGGMKNVKFAIVPKGIN